jgi:hypothetical protein
MQVTPEAGRDTAPEAGRDTAVPFGVHRSAFTAVESGEVGLAPCLRPLAQTARAVFPQAAFLCGRHLGSEVGLTSSALARESSKNS